MPVRTKTCAKPLSRSPQSSSTLTPAEIKANLVAQLTTSVRWTATVQNMIADGADEFIEFGPGKVLQGLVSKINKKVAVSGHQ